MLLHRFYCFPLPLYACLLEIAFIIVQPIDWLTASCRDKFCHWYALSHSYRRIIAIRLTSPCSCRLHTHTHTHTHYHFGCRAAFPSYVHTNSLFTATQLLTISNQLIKIGTVARNRYSVSMSTKLYYTNTGNFTSTSVFQFRRRLETELFACSHRQSFWICLCVTVTHEFCFVILNSLDLCHVYYYSNTD